MTTHYRLGAFGFVLLLFHYQVRMQTAGAGGSATVFGMLSQTFAKEGIRGIYRGASAPLASISFIFAVCFCT